MLGSNVALLIFELTTVLTSLIFIFFLSVKNVNVTLKPPNDSEVNVQAFAWFNWSNVTEIVSFSNTAMFTNVTFRSCHVTGRAPPPSRERALSWIRKSRVNKARECLALKRRFTFSRRGVTRTGGRREPSSRAILTSGNFSSCGSRFRFD